MQVLNGADFEQKNVLIGGGETEAFGVTNDPILMNMLSTGLYQKPMRTMIQETMFNAWDAHRMGDCQDTPINIYINDTSGLIIRDYSESLNTDVTPEKQKKDIVKMAKSSQKTGMTWDDAPKEVIAVFEDIRLEKGSKSAIAALHNTSTRTMGRWADKYDYDGYVKFKASSMTVAEQARAYFQQGAFEALAAFKKAKKKSYSALGFIAKEEK